jgi:hypothetical protein
LRDVKWVHLGEIHPDEFHLGEFHPEEVHEGEFLGKSGAGGFSG